MFALIIFDYQLNLVIIGMNIFLRRTKLKKEGRRKDEMKLEKREGEVGDRSRELDLTRLVR